MMADPQIRILLLSLGELREVDGHLLSSLRAKAYVEEVTWDTDALERLTVPSKFKAVIVTDAAVTVHGKVLARLVEHAGSGGVVVFACRFSSFCGRLDMNAMWKYVWSLPWTSASYCRTTFTLNTSVAGMDLADLAHAYSMKAVQLDHVPSNAALYLRASESSIESHVFASDPVQNSTETPVAFTSFGSGRVGYVGDVNYEQESLAVILAMCLSETVSQNQNATGLNPRSVNGKPIILMLSLEKEPWFEESYSQLYSALAKNAMLHEAQTVRSATLLLYPSAPPLPSAVLITDAAITSSAYLSLQYRLIEYAKAGGRVILGCEFSNHLQLGSAASFFARWGLTWDAGVYYRTTFSVNPAGIPAPLSGTALFAEYSMKALHVKNISRETAVYIPTIQSHIESHVFPATPITGAQLEQSPAMFVRIGDGYLGYVGDVNGEQQTIRLLLEMCGVQVKPGDLGTRDHVTGIRMEPDGTMDAMHEQQAELPLPVFQERHGGHSRAAEAARSTEPVQPPQSVRPVRTARPRDSEVATRAAKRLAHSNQQRAIAERLKEEGNNFFRAQEWAGAADKYRAAAFAHGPRPVYMTNLAAALLKLEQWVEAESAADRALRYEPKNIKARFRRGVARKEREEYADAIRDFYSVLRLDPNNSEAHAELTETLALSAIDHEDPLNGDVDDMRSEDRDAYSDVITESDSPEFTMTGPGYKCPCKFYNNQGCRKGMQCLFKHAPDERSVRDELGRNVCKMWLLNACPRSTCYYAHDKTYLPVRGWWTHEQRLTEMRSYARDLVTLNWGLNPKEVEKMVNMRWPSWRLDMWALVESYRDDYDPEEDLSDEEALIEERMENFGFTGDDLQELLCQGVKPWDDDAWDVLDALQNM
ncbi:hypothetical protein BKA93DRAFT_930024 [Sparassis latifolia]